MIVNLSIDGKKQCLDLKNRLKVNFDKIYVSRLERTRKLQIYYLMIVIGI